MPRFVSIRAQWFGSVRFGFPPRFRRFRGVHDASWVPLPDAEGDVSGQKIGSPGGYTGERLSEGNNPHLIQTNMQNPQRVARAPKRAPIACTGQSTCFFSHLGGSCGFDPKSHGTSKTYVFRSKPLIVEIPKLFPLPK